MWPCSSQTHQTKIHTTPLKPNTDTDTPSESYCSATPFTVFHNFTSSSISPIIPRDCTVSHDNPIMTSSYCITFIRAGETMRMYFWISVSGDCSFVFVSCVCVCVCMSARSVLPTDPSSLIWWWVHSGTLCATSALPAATGNGCFVTDERCREADGGLQDPDPVGCKTRSMETGKKVIRFMLGHRV